MIVLSSQKPRQHKDMNRISVFLSEIKASPSISVKRLSREKHRYNIASGIETINDKSPIS